MNLALFAATLLTAGQPYTPTSVTVIDGDTIKADGVTIRISNLDTPERGARAACDAERFLALHASARAEQLAKSGAIAIVPEGRTDRYDRQLARVTVSGRDWAAIMIEESLAVSWSGRQHDWCADAQ